MEVQQIKQALVVDVLVILLLLLLFCLAHPDYLLLELNEDLVGQYLLEPLRFQCVFPLPYVFELRENIQSVALLDVRQILLAVVVQDESRQVCEVLVYRVYGCGYLFWLQILVELSRLKAQSERDRLSDGFLDLPGSLDH